MMNRHMAEISRSFDLVQNVALVSISVNPEFDTPSILEDYQKKKGYNSKNWYFLTGSRADIQKLAVVSFKLGAVDEPVFHSAYLTLIDRHGLIRGYYDGMKREEMNRLFKDAANLIKENP